mmetsp:Transcript_12533/g.21018  ORF Transcript_12533/g.21018 Transcript_12533/m.21018 type:complete len:473 (-) Transcript_12533:244-1662(-)|eukprot:CAMPEP_0119309480 /NCGR_PEP_ID=MMETSP1333-20130426/15787_1 /TAXON_ID=418940 /ORGANISM="Scyphosphaera apsteinii, Strain RCC1455" /LENGTH=472 /DNA_ID=CAMNT_0007313467 /DNA_START=110 /DNA_END=1528 /DNA_ORIENTATION=-
MVLTWLAALVASSLTFALADILCDICIAEQQEGQRQVETAADDDDSDGIEMQQDTVPTTDDGSDSDFSSSRSPSNTSLGVLAQNPRYKQIDVNSPAPIEHWNESPPDSAVETGLTGEQDTAIAGIVTIAGLIVTVLYWMVTGPPAGTIATRKFKWGPFTHLQFWFAMLGGSMAFLHYYFLLKAFEGAPSTVLLPLVQVASVSTLLGSSVVALFRHEAWITPVHGLAYVLMFVGGILPATGGQLSALFHRSFWRQAFVSFAIFAEFALGLHDLMLSGCAYHSAKPLEAASVDGSESDAVESFEFFVWSRLSFVLTFFFMYSVSPKLNTQLRELFSGRISTKFITLSALSEGLTVVGFYLASIAYGLFYQAGIVHAAEASLSQLLNLLLAFILLKCFGIGRSSAVGSMPAKLVSFVMVTLGLFLCTFDEGSPQQATSTAPALPALVPVNSMFSPPPTSRASLLGELSPNAVQNV